MRTVKLTFWSAAAAACIGALMLLPLHAAAVDVAPHPRQAQMDVEAAQEVAELCQRLLQMHSGKKVRVSLCTKELPDETAVELYCRDRQMQTLHLSGSVATQPLAPGRYWVEAGGRQTYFTVTENAAVIDVSGFGYTDGELLWLTLEEGSDAA